MAKDAALVEEATRLYVEEGLSIAQIAEELPEASRRTLESWSLKYNWTHRRKTYRKQNQDLDDFIRKIKLRLAKLLVGDEEGDRLRDPQLIYALAKGLAVLKPSAAIELRRLEKEEEEGKRLSPEEKRAKVKEAIESIYGITA